MVKHNLWAFTWLERRSGCNRRATFCSSVSCSPTNTNSPVLIILFRPYSFASGAQGLIFISPFIGSLFGTYLCGPLADRIANWATKRNHGIREPEMRLPACAIAVILTFSGALIASLMYQAKTHWAGPIVGFGVLSAGAQMGATLAMAYSLDCHKEVIFLSSAPLKFQSADQVTVVW